MLHTDVASLWISKSSSSPLLFSRFVSDSFWSIWLKQECFTFLFCNQASPLRHRHTRKAGIIFQGRSQYHFGKTMKVCNTAQNKSEKDKHGRPEPKRQCSVSTDIRHSWNSLFQILHLQSPSWRLLSLAMSESLADLRDWDYARKHLVFECKSKRTPKCSNMKWNKRLNKLSKIMAVKNRDHWSQIGSQHSNCYQRQNVWLDKTGKMFLKSGKKDIVDPKIDEENGFFLKLSKCDCKRKILSKNTKCNRISLVPLVNEIIGKYHLKLNGNARNMSPRKWYGYTCAFKRETSLWYDTVQCCVKMQSILNAGLTGKAMLEKRNGYVQYLMKILAESRRMNLRCLFAAKEKDKVLLDVLSFMVHILKPMWDSPHIDRLHWGETER